MAISVIKENPNFVLDDSLGIVVPIRALGEGRFYPHPFDSVNRGYVRDQGILQFNRKLGIFLGHDPETGIAFWPSYASGLDDMLMRAMVQGYMANVGTTAVPITLLSTIVTKIQSMVGTWVMTVRGKTSPVKKTLDLMARAQDSQFGAAEFIRLYMGALLVENRGAMGAQVPIESIPFDNWDQYDMVAEPIANQPTKDNNLFVLRMTTEAFRENQGLWMIDGLHAWPTGNSEYPYWFRTYSHDTKRDMWVLIHRDFGWQISQEAGARNTLYPGFGQSGSWRFSPYAVKHMAIDRQDWEHLINQPARGVVWVSGLDYPTQFRDQMQKYEEEREQQEMYFYPGVFFGGSRGENSKISVHPWSEPPAGYTAEGWRKEWVDNLAASFHLNVTHLEVRLGEGAMTQSDIASSLEAETAVAAMKQRIEALFNHVAPPRILVTVVWQTDRLKRFQTETFRELSLGISRVQKDPRILMGEESLGMARDTFNREEIRGLFEEFVGIDIPVLEEDERVETNADTGDDIEERWVSAFEGRTIAEMVELDPYAAALTFIPGNIVRFVDTGKIAILSRWVGASTWVWVRTSDNYDMLVDASRLVMLARAETRERPEIDAVVGNHGDHVYVMKRGIRAGDRVRTEQGTLCTVTGIVGDNAYVSFDWDTDDIDPREVPLSRLRAVEFMPEGEPLEPVLNVQVDPERAADDARASWEQYADDDVEDLI